MKDVLIVEDDYFIATLISEIMEDHHYSVSAIINNVDEGVEFVKQQDLDFAILDYNIIGGTSTPIAEQLKLKSIPYVLLSGNVTHLQEKESQRGFQFLSKPFSELSLLNTITDLLN